MGCVGACKGARGDPIMLYVLSIDYNPETHVGASYYLLVQLNKQLMLD